jgi:SAM-dependent methyltransferase
MNPFRREPMLREMNRQVILRLCPDQIDGAIYDLGCGLGATMRSFVRRFPGRKIIGVTLVPWQIQKACQLNVQQGLDAQIELIQADYMQVPVEDGSIGAAYALESCCHSPGEDKEAFLKELYRILEPGGRCVIVDGFTKVPRVSFSKIFRYCVDQTCSGWALPCFPVLDPFLTTMEKRGFSDITTEDFSWRVAPTALHSPFCVAGFIFKKWIQGERLNKVRIGHLKSCVLGLILGISRRQFGYYCISATKPVHN